MAVIDSQGRLFGKINILDIGAGLIILFTLIGIFVFPGATTSVAQTTKPVEVEVVVRVAAQNVNTLFKPGEQTKIIIRNQPAGALKIKEVKELPDTVFVPMDGGKGTYIPDPRPEVALSKNMILTLSGNAQIRDDGPVISNNKIKIGTPIELEGFSYSFANLNVRDIRILD